MAIEKVKIENLKRFRKVEVAFSPGMNVLVGPNEAGKSTVLEAIHLAVSGLVGGRPLRQELSQHLFNNAAVQEYLQSLIKPPYLPAPRILIEIYLSEDRNPLFYGDGNSDGIPATGFRLEVHPDDDYKSEYAHLVRTKGVRTLPIEYYTTTLLSFSRNPLTPRGVPLRSALIDSTSPRSHNGADHHVARILRDFLDIPDAVAIARAYREMRESFGSDPSIAKVNDKIRAQSGAGDRSVTLNAPLPTRAGWEDGLVTCVDSVPFQHIGKGAQSRLKTNLAMNRRPARE